MKGGQKMDFCRILYMLIIIIIPTVLYYYRNYIHDIHYFKLFIKIMSLKFLNGFFVLIKLRSMFMV